MHLGWSQHLFFMYSNEWNVAKIRSLQDISTISLVISVPQSFVILRQVVFLYQSRHTRSNVWSMLGHRLRRWPNIDSTWTYASYFLHSRPEPRVILSSTDHVDSCIYPCETKQGKLWRKLAIWVEIGDQVEQQTTQNLFIASWRRLSHPS